MRYMFAMPSQEVNQYTEGRDDPTANKLDNVVGCWNNPLHDTVSAKSRKTRPSVGTMTPSAWAPLMPAHLSIECLTIGPTKMSYEEETPPHMETSTGRSVEFIAPPGPLGSPAPWTLNKTKST